MEVPGPLELELPMIWMVGSEWTVSCVRHVPCQPKQVRVAWGTAGRGHDECIVLTEDPGPREEDRMAL